MSANDSHEKKTTHPRGDHQEAAERRRGLGQTPEPVFLDTEGGTHHLDVARLDAAATWEEITATVTQLAKADHPFNTLVIDATDWLEKRLAEHLCRKFNKDSIEDFGYGKGRVLLTEEFARFLNSLDALLARGNAATSPTCPTWSAPSNSPLGFREMDSKPSTSAPGKTIP